MNIEKHCTPTTSSLQNFESAFFNTTETYIHPTAVIGINVQLGSNVKIGPFCVVIGNVTIGDNTRIHAHSTIGYPGQVTGLIQNYGTIEIGSHCEIREFVTIHSSRYEHGKTIIGNNAYLMNFAHVSHDSILEDHVTLINNVSLGGHSHIGKSAIIMANSATHQFCKIGELTALAPFSGIRQDLPPFCLFSGQPAQFFGLNLIGLKRSGLKHDDIDALNVITKQFYKDKLSLDSIKKNIDSNVLLKQNMYVNTFLHFITQSTRGISRKAASDKKHHHDNFNT